MEKLIVPVVPTVTPAVQETIVFEVSVSGVQLRDGPAVPHAGTAGTETVKEPEFT